MFIAERQVWESKKTKDGQRATLRVVTVRGSQVDCCTDTGRRRTLSAESLQAGYQFVGVDLGVVAPPLAD